ncbi:MAG: site-specific DNA-methyltransferase [Desulfobacterales bacterium]|nr:site-specific DNA-methyltransferase [Desulfobacterales bacterium]
MDKMTEQEGASLDVVGENIQALKQILPDAFTEDKIDFDALRQLLGDAVDEGEGKYGLNWHGKKKARQIALTPSTGTLRPCPEESVDWDTTQNLFIEGDNLEVLKLLQKSYANKVKMIYIDPPYNTGNEFIYPDKFQDNLDTYLRYTGQKGEEGFKTSSNTESSGRYHTNWLNMIYPRLKLGRNLLRDDGVIFISIDDNEDANMKKICDEIFGEENFCAKFVWQKKYSRDNRPLIGTTHEYILMYAKNIASFSETRNLLPPSEESLKVYRNPNNDPRGRWRPIPLTAQAGHATPSQFYEITTPTGAKHNPPEGRCWSVTKERFEELLKEGKIYFGKDGSSQPNLIRYIDEVKGFVPWTWLPSSDVGHTDSAMKEFYSILSKEAAFETPKPTTLLTHFLRIATKKDDYILDFFAGTGSMAHSTIGLNSEDAGSRKFIMVQLPELCDEKSSAFKAGYRTIADIGKERIRRAGAKIKEENPDHDGDLGFKVFRLDSSNIRVWTPDRNDLEGTLYEHTEHLVPGRSEEDVLYELLLKRGVDLTVPIESKEISGKTVYSIGYGVLFACLNTTINRDEVEELAQGIAAWHKELSPASDTQVVFRDSAFADDVAKTNMTAILEQNGIKHVRSL